MLEQDSGPPIVTAGDIVHYVGSIEQTNDSKDNVLRFLQVYFTKNSSARQRTEYQVIHAKLPASDICYEVIDSLREMVETNNPIIRQVVPFYKKLSANKFQTNMAIVEECAIDVTVLSHTVHCEL